MSVIVSESLFLSVRLSVRVIKTFSVGVVD